MLWRWPVTAVLVRLFIAKAWLVVYSESFLDSMQVESMSFAKHPKIATCETSVTLQATESEQIGSAILSAIKRKEASVSWSEISLPHLLGYGSVLYGVEQSLMYPSELLRTRLQIDTRPSTRLWTEAIKLSRHIHHYEGLRGFYRGFQFSTLGGIPSQLICLVTYNWCKEAIETFGGERWRNTGIAPLIAGALAEGVTAAYWVPLDIIVQRLQIQGRLDRKLEWERENPFVQRWALNHGQRRSPYQVLREIIRQDGVFGLWRGIGAHYCSFIPQAGIWWASYEQSKILMAGHASDDLVGTPVHIAAGVSAGAITVLLTNPLDIVKVRIQTQVAVERNAFLTFCRMIKHEGMCSLGKGLAPRLWLSVPVSAVSSVCYELVMSLSMKPNTQAK